MGKLSLDEIIRAPDIATKEIEVPEWNGSVIITTFSLARRDQLLKHSMVNGSVQNDLLVPNIIMHGIVDPIIDESRVAELKLKSFRVLERIAREIMALNGMLQEDATQIERAFRPDTGPTGSA